MITGNQFREVEDEGRYAASSTFISLCIFYESFQCNLSPFTEKAIKKLVLIPATFSMVQIHRSAKTFLNYGKLMLDCLISFKTFCVDRNVLAGLSPRRRLVQNCAKSAYFALIDYIFFVAVSGKQVSQTVETYRLQESKKTISKMRTGGKGNKQDTSGWRRSILKYLS